MKKAVFIVPILLVLIAIAWFLGMPGGYLPQANANTQSIVLQPGDSITVVAGTPTATPTPTPTPPRATGQLGTSNSYLANLLLGLP
jgi:hypothetical protein